MANDDNTRHGNGSKRAKATRVVAGVLSGKTVNQVAEDMGTSQQAVSKLLNSKEAKSILDRANDKSVRMVTRAMEKFEALLDSDDEATVYKTARDILKSAGVLKDKVDLSHSFPMPTIIRRRNGEEIILTTTSHVESDDSGEDPSE